MAYSTSFLFVAGIIVVLASNISLTSAEPSKTLSDILLPTPNITSGAVGEITCYALPYGAVGIISHLLTYWTIAWMAVGQIPLWPWHRMTTWRFDMFLAALALCTCVPIASITMHRCRLSWHFLLICIWKLVTSVSLACMTLHRCLIVREEQRRKGSKDIEFSTRHQYHPAMNHEPYDNGIHAQLKSRSGFFSQHSGPSKGAKNIPAPLWWLVLYLSGTIVGMVGLCSLLYTTFRTDLTIRHLTYGFGAAMGLIPLLVAIYWYMHHLDLPQGGSKVYWSAVRYTFFGSILAFTAVFGFFSSLYSDLVLGRIADNLFGLPSQDFAPLYWAWFVAKRLPMLSF
ncbi:hypothetical protein HBI56_053750 [Parastagonospora nodorum]|uniref:Uncharacterized protein n=2 Tax=Phaeosphaeria nodorum (strain SN15 / ATCC MYA-4574 / FGSC 10173) TaxID=321614 RepID=A0A7U2NR35_PHANO|nr:hypothetical protein HBH56_098330 [Parastagonospora nodorum]QRD07367.1 hypothetical protein JI435_132360 [Parastagonospora nodorum SN15]KAH3930414.1 hypothetical protein HBH54_112650 [Parastagonospora nodorum]KAH3938976.1 hypothetical protein HBH53_242020 [Parastagonospora nodorum]KAH3964682.1 hypothetical protein HBH51_159370 [Parastagonospora nodorum]